MQVEMLDTTTQRWNNWDAPQ